MGRNQTIDVFRFLFSFFIIAIHAQIFQQMNMTLYNLTVRGLFRIAVPFFFVVSGYFYYDRVQKNKPLKPYFLKLIKYFAIFEFIEILINGPFMLGQWGMGIVEFLWRVLVTGLGGAYWYLFSLIVSLWILTPFFKKGKIYPLLIVGLILNILSMSIDSYSFLFEGTQFFQLMNIQTYLFRWPQAGFNMSLFYLSLGALIKNNQVHLKHETRHVLIGFILLLIESFMTQKSGAIDANSYFSLYYLTPVLMLWTLDHPDCKLYQPYHDNLSFMIYMLHPLFLGIVSALLWSLPSEIKFLITAIICYGLGRFIVSKIEKKQISHGNTI